MAHNKMSDLRDHLFETLEALKDKDAPMDLERAKAVCSVAQTIINSAKVEVDLVKAVSGDRGSDFFGSAAARPSLEERMSIPEKRRIA